MLNKDVLKNLTKGVKEPCISIYLPTHKEWNFMEEDITRYKNILRKAEMSLEEKIPGKKERDHLFKPAIDLLEDKDFWNHQSDGLAVFIAPETFYTYNLPKKFDEELIVSKRFHLKPLLELLSGDGKFFVLALDLNETKLYEASRFSIRLVDLPAGTIISYAEAVKWDDPEKSLQFHTGTKQSAAQGKGGARAAIFHGHGSGSMDDSVHKEKILEFFHLLNKGVFEVIKDENVPLVLAGIEYLMPIYRKANSYPHIFNKGIDVNPEDLSVEQLHNNAYKLIKPVFEKAEEISRSKYEQFSGNNKASGLIENVVKSAYAKKIESLFVDGSSHVWGEFIEEENKVIIKDNSENKFDDLLDFAALHTLFNGGQVFVVDKDRMPNKSEVAAVYRY